MSSQALQMRSSTSPAKSAWTGSTAMMDLEDPRLRIKSLALTQMCKTDRDKALAIYLFVKRLPFRKTLKLQTRTARQVLDRGEGDAEDKACLLVALLRSSGIGARLVYRELDGKVMRGLTRLVGSAGRPAVQVLLGARWSTTDTFIFDAKYVAAAKSRMQHLRWDFGFGIHYEAQTLWNGQADAFLTGSASHELPILGVFHDPLGFADSSTYHKRFGGLGRRLSMGIAALGIKRNVELLRGNTFLARS